MSPKTPVFSIREQISERIRSDILTGALSEGDVLREQDLANRFGVSRGPIRDVLLQLTQEGLLISKPNRGVTVGGGLDKWIQPLVVDLRQRIEVFALKKVFTLLTGSTIRRMEKTVENLRTACENQNLAAVAKHDMAFHRHILELAQDDNLIAIWLPIVVQMSLHYTRHKDMMDNYREHLGILEALRKKDLKAAEEALKKNIQ